MAKTQITQTEYLQLTGLLALSASLNKQIAAIERAAGELLGVPSDQGYYGHVSDAVYSNFSAEDVLSKLGIVIEAPILRPL